MRSYPDDALHPGCTSRSTDRPKLELGFAQSAYGLGGKMEPHVGPPALLTGLVPFLGRPVLGSDGALTLRQSSAFRSAGSYGLQEAHRRARDQREG